MAQPLRGLQEVRRHQHGAPGRRQTGDGLAHLARARRIAVLGIKPEEKSAAPAHYVASYLQRVGYEIVPVPVYYPDAKEILGEKVYRTVSEIPGDVDLVVVFRRPSDIPPHVDDIVAKRPKAVWFQLGVIDEHMYPGTRAFRSFEYPSRVPAEVQARMDRRVEEVVMTLIVPWRKDIGHFVADVVRSWETDTIVDRVELAVGKDLQYIRVNGTLVGAAVGCTIFAVSELIR